MHKARPITSTPLKSSIQFVGPKEEKNLKQESIIDEDYIDQLSPEEMKQALEKIAQEVHRFRTGFDTKADDDELGIYKSKLFMKNKQIKILRDNLNIACVVAKSLTMSKEKECLSLNKQLAEIKNENKILQNTNTENLDTIQKLKMENDIQLKRTEQLKNFIDLGYRELQKIRNQPVNETSIEMRLKEILLCCGQFYADYRNEQDRNEQLEQKIRFLTTRLSITERELDAATQELKRRGKTYFKASPCKLNKELNLKKLKECRGFVDIISPSNLDLSTHMSLVKDLLSNQDTMLNDLKQLAKELQCLNS